LEYPAVLSWLTRATLWLELVGPELLFLPVVFALPSRWLASRPSMPSWLAWLFQPECIGYLRLPVIAAFVALHVGTALCMTLGIFPWVSIVAWAVFLPSLVWESRLARRLGRWLTSWASQSPRPMPDVFTPSPATRTVHWAAEGACLFFLVAVAWWNIAGIKAWHMADVAAPEWFERFGNVTMIQQKWNMFARPPKNDGWYVAAATLRNGSRIDVLRGGVAVDVQKPEQISAQFPNHRWRKLFRTLSRPEFAGYRQPVAEYLCRDWNERHEPDEQIIEFTLMYFEERAGPDERPGEFASATFAHVTLGAPEESGNFAEEIRALKQGKTLRGPIP
jgi:hypothetical protein